jgi:hypothetical protein
MKEMCQSKSKGLAASPLSFLFAKQELRHETRAGKAPLIRVVQQISN